MLGRASRELIEVVRLLDRLGIPAKLTIVGRSHSSELKLMTALIHKFGLESRVDICGRLPREEVRQKYRSHDLFIYQSMDDGSPRTVLEALACGIPTIASRHPGIDVLDPNGEIIQFTEYGDVDRIVELVQEFSDHRQIWRERAIEGRNHIVESFDSKVVAKAYRDFYLMATGKSLSHSNGGVRLNR